VDLIGQVIAARKAAEAENTHPEGPRSEAQNAAILIAQVKEIMNHFSSEDKLLGMIFDLDGRIKELEAKPSVSAPKSAVVEKPAPAPAEIKAPPAAKPVIVEDNKQ
jgi:hypothetical protein